MTMIMILKGSLGAMCGLPPPGLPRMTGEEDEMTER